MKKFIAVLIAAIMAFGVVPDTAFAAEGGADSEYPYGESTEGRITIYDGDDTYYVYEEGSRGCCLQQGKEHPHADIR